MPVPRIPGMLKRRRPGELPSAMDVVVTAPERPSTERQRSRPRPRGASIRRYSAGPVSAPWAGDRTWGRKQSPWLKNALSKDSSKIPQLPAIDVNPGSSTPDLGLLHDLGYQIHTPPTTPGGKPDSQLLLRRQSIESVSTVTSWADQLMALGARKPEDSQIKECLPTVVSPGTDQNLSMQGVVAHETLRPPSARSVTSDGGCSTRSAHFKLVNGQLTPLIDGRAGVATEKVCSSGDCNCNDVQNLTAANLAKLESKSSTELCYPCDDGTEEKKKKKGRKAKRYRSSSTAKSGSPKSTKSAKSVKSTKSNLSDGSVVSGKSFKTMFNVVRAVHALQRPLRHEGRHAHRGRYECQYCFDDLASRPVALLMGASKERSCNHLYHQDCCAAMQERANKQGASRRARCPCCSKAFVSYVNLPDPETETEKWFNALDYKQCGKVDREDVMDHLMAVLQVKTALRASLAPPNSRLNLPSCKALIDRLNGSSNKSRRRTPPVSPDVEKNPSEWFTFWDIYEDGMLNRCGATRALMKTFRKYDKLLLRAAIDDVWPEVVASGSEAEKELITKDHIFEPNSGLIRRVLIKVQAAFHWKLLREMTPG